MGKQCSKLNTNVAARGQLTSKELRQWQRIINNEFPNGLIDKRGFSEMLQQRMSRHSHAIARLGHIVLSVYGHDGPMDVKNFMRALSVTTKGNINEKLDVIFKLLDTENNTYLTQHKMRAMLTAVHEILIAEGHTAAELRHEGVIETWIEDMFHRFDPHNEAKFYIDQFRLACLSNQFVIEALSMGKPHRRRLHREHNK